jgi:hypothetical protein
MSALLEKADEAMYRSKRPVVMEFRFSALTVRWRGFGGGRELRAPEDRHFREQKPQNDQAK